MDTVSDKAKNIKSNIFKYCDQRCKATKEFHASDLTTPEMHDFIVDTMEFVFGRMEAECWGLDDLLGEKCPDKTRATLFTTGKYKSRKAAVIACSKNISTKKIKEIFEEVWKKCVKSNKE